MAQRAKGTYRGQKYTRKSLRPGKRTIHVRGYCRRKRSGLALWEKSALESKEWGW
jgi:hypothetical protein